MKIVTLNFFLGQVLVLKLILQKFFRKGLKTTEEQQALKQKRDKAHAKLRRAERDGWGDEDALRRDYEEARVAYADMRNSSGLRHGRGVASMLERSG